MVTAHFERKRPALSTVGRAARGLLGIWDGATPVVIAGTASARSENRLHVLALSKERNALVPISIVSAPAEIWSLDTVYQGSYETAVIVAARRAGVSAVELWKLDGLSDLRRVTADGSGQLGDGEALQASASDSIGVAGEILKVCKNLFNPTTYLCVTHTSASTVDSSQALKEYTSLAVSNHNFSSQGKLMKLVNGEWIDANTALLASQKSIGIFDARTGDVSNVLSMKKILESSKPDASDFWVPPHPSRLASVSSDNSNVLYAGFQDGWIRALDIRANSLVWQAQHAPHQWVSALSYVAEKGIVSGGTDGVVRYWTRDGAPVATFPQHDDTVTNISCCEDYFATVSYDGRVSINEMPVGR